MEYLVGLLIVVIGLLVSIALHEVGHLVPAKRFGVRVSTYMVGFGPTLWSRTRGETEYGLKAIPLGGYVRMVGMLPSSEAVGARSRAGRMAELVAAAREASAEEVRPGEEHRAFYRLTAPRKVVVMLGGPMMNLVLAFVFLAIATVGIGVPGGATTTVSGTVDCILPAGVERECRASDPPTPAVVAGLEPGDRLISYAGTAIESWEQFQQAVRTVEDDVVPLVVERAGEQVTLEVSPVTTELPVRDEDGQVVQGADGAVVTEPSRYIGFRPTSGLERQPLSAVPALVGQATWETGKIVVALPVRLYDVVQTLVTGAERDPASVMGVVGVGRVAGEIASADGPQATVAYRAAVLLSLLASLNVALFVFNLIPLLPLDGGHVAGAVWEGAKRQVARLRGAPRPRPVDVARQMPFAYGVFVVLIGMFVLLTWADIVAPVTLT